MSPRSARSVPSGVLRARASVYGHGHGHVYGSGFRDTPLRARLLAARRAGLRADAAACVAANRAHVARVGAARDRHRDFGAGAPLLRARSAGLRADAAARIAANLADVARVGTARRAVRRYRTALDLAARRARRAARAAARIATDLTFGARRRTAPNAARACILHARLRGSTVLRSARRRRVRRTSSGGRDDARPCQWRDARGARTPSPLVGPGTAPLGQATGM